MDEKFELLKHAVSCYKVNAANRYINKKELLEFIDEIELLMLGGVGNQREQCEHRYAFLVPNGGGLMQCSDCGEEI